MVNGLLPPVLTRRRIVLACCVAILADFLQLVMAPLGPLDDGIDVVAMVLQTLILGFHPLLLPTFIVKLIPIADLPPTWTACTLIVIALRRRKLAPSPPPPVTPHVASEVIDV